VTVNNTTDRDRVNAAWSVIHRWRHRERDMQADRLFYEMSFALTRGADQPVTCAMESLTDGPRPADIATAQSPQESLSWLPSR
jgi:hypothetical protein